METGRFTIEQLSEGFFELFRDGSFVKMGPSRIENLPDDPSLGVYSSAIGIDPVLISDGVNNIVADPGLGWGLDHKSSYQDTSNIITNLDIFGIQPRDVNYVILTHLHFDHAAGSTFVDPNSATKATFPNARYLVQKLEWDYAVQRQIEKDDDTPGANYKLDELYKLAADNQLEFIEDGNFELLKGVNLIRTGGHTPGHQVVQVSDSGETAYFLGDLIPTEHHLNHYAMKVIDYDPVQAKKVKTLFLRKALKENARLYFYHSLFNKTGLLAKDKNKNYVLIDDRQKRLS